MGIIMVLILEKLEEIQPEILSLLGNVRKENQNVLPIARKLGEGVIESCDSKLMPYFLQAEQRASFPLKHDRSELQDSPVVDEDREETNKEQDFEDQYGETGENGEEKILEEEDIILEGEVVKEKSRKRTRKDLQKLVVDMDKEETSRQRVSEEENREKGQKGEEKVLKKERIITENEVVKEKSRKRAKTDQEPVVDKNREESSQEQISEEENIEEGEKGDEEVSEEEEEYEDEGMVSEGEVVKEMSKGRAKKNHNVNDLPLYLLVNLDVTGLNY